MCTWDSLCCTFNLFTYALDLRSLRRETCPRKLQSCRSWPPASTEIRTNRVQSSLLALPKYSGYVIHQRVSMAFRRDLPSSTKNVLLIFDCWHGLRSSQSAHDSKLSEPDCSTTDLLRSLLVRSQPLKSYKDSVNNDFGRLNLPAESSWIY